MAQKVGLDKLDFQIINEMMENAETSYAELGKKLAVSGGTIHVRMKKLQEVNIVTGSAHRARPIVSSAQDRCAEAMATPPGAPAGARRG